MRWAEVNGAADGITHLVNASTTTYGACETLCQANTSCAIWWWYANGQRCNLYSGVVATDNVIIPGDNYNNVVGTALWSASSGYTVPRVHSGPALSPPASVSEDATLFKVSRQPTLVFSFPPPMSVERSRAPLPFFLQVFGADFYVHETTSPGGGTQRIGETTAAFGTYGCALSTIITPAPTTSGPTAPPTAPNRLPPGFPSNTSSTTCGFASGTTTSSMNGGSSLTVFGWLVYYGYPPGTVPTATSSDTIGVHRVLMTVNTTATLLSRSTIVDE